MKDVLTLRDVIDSLYTINETDTLQVSNTRELIDDLEKAQFFSLLLPLSAIVFVIIFKSISGKLAPTGWGVESRLFYNTVRIGQLIPLFAKRFGWLHQKRALIIARDYDKIFEISPLQREWRTKPRYKWFADLLMNTQLQKVLNIVNLFYDKIVYCLKTKKLHDDLLIILDNIADFLFLLTINVNTRLRRKIFLIKKPNILQDGSLLVAVTAELEKISIIEKPPIVVVLLQRIFRIKKIPIDISVGLKMDRRILFLFSAIFVLLFFMAMIYLFLGKITEALFSIYSALLDIVIAITGEYAADKLKNKSKENNKRMS